MEEQAEVSGQPYVLEARDKRFSWSKFVTTGAAGLTLALPVLYVLGLAYDQGYQSVFKVPGVAQSHDLYETLTFGFIALYRMIGTINEWMAMHWPIMLAYGAVAGALVAVGLWKGDAIEKMREQSQRWLRRHKHTRNVFSTAIASIFVFVTPYVLVTLLYLLLSLPLLGYFVGKEVAGKTMERYATTCELADQWPNKYERCITAKGPNGPIRGYIVATTATHFAISSNGLTRVIRMEGWEFEDTYKQ